MNEENVLCAELALCKYFTERGADNPVPVKEIMKCMRIYLQGAGVRRPEIREARKRLGILSEAREGVHFWRWAGSEDPKRIWKEKSMELARRTLP